MKLYNGNNIPEIGLGTWLIPNDKVAKIVKTGVSLGYRHIDTAQAYQNEEGVGIGIKECNVRREKLIITSKVMAEIKDYQGAYDSVIESLRKLQLDYLDLILIHSPEPWREFRNASSDYFEENLAVWRALETLYKEGKVKAIGVSNFRIKDLDNILKHCEIKPMVNQYLAHIGQVPYEIFKYCKDHDIVFEAYSPIAHGEASRFEVVNELAERYNKSFAQICLRFLNQTGMVVLPKASSEAHLRENLDLDFIITKEDMRRLEKVEPLPDYGKSDIFPCFKESGK